MLFGFAGCDSGSDSTTEIDTSDPAQVGTTFIEDVAAGRVEACQGSRFGSGRPIADRA